MLLCAHFDPVFKVGLDLTLYIVFTYCLFGSKEEVSLLLYQPRHFSASKGK